MIDNLINIVRFIVTAITLIIWGVVGFVLWIPLLTRMIAYFVSMIAASSFISTNVAVAQQRLNYAIEFYINGFRKIIGVMTKTSSDEEVLQNTLPTRLEEFFKVIATDLIWTIIFWLLFIYWLF